MFSKFNLILKQMVNRRILLQGGVAVLLSQLPILKAKAAETQSQKAVILSEIARLDLPAVSLQNWTVTASHLTFPGGAPLFPVHKHPGFLIGYVLEGEFRFQLQGQPEKIVPMGQLFYEPPESIHLIGSSASTTKPAKVLALIFTEKGKQTTTLI
jgi:quercetin dioxygenase-like cupin family protein